jgi:N6-L-threonylcarbamoyladenine synthase
MKILGIESSCDETAASIVEDGIKVLSNKIASQVEIHARYGGVVPEVASRQHMLSIIPIIQQAMTEAQVSWRDIGAVAVTMGPGLAGSLLVGVNAAKAIVLAQHLPLLGTNHLEAHIYANWLTGAEICFPVICLIVSGGHSDLVLMKDHGDYTLLGSTRDDAAGEAFDKAARILGLGYPGGPLIQKAAEQGTPIIRLPHAWLVGTNDFSFSGIKTALLRMVERGEVALEGESAAESEIPPNLPLPKGGTREGGSRVSPFGEGGLRGIYGRNDAAASFQKAVIEVLVAKTVSLAKETRVNQILLAGGVAANKELRRQLTDTSPFPVLIPPFVYCTDNAAMVASCGFFRYRAGRTDGLELDAVPNLRLA